VILSQKIQLIEILAISFYDFFQLSHHLCEGGYKYDFCRALPTRQFFKKNRITIASKKIARAAAA